MVIIDNTETKIEDEDEGIDTYDSFQSVRLQRSGNYVDYCRFPENVIVTIQDVFESEPDPHVILIVYSYMFCRLTINKLRDMFILSDGHGTRYASREYIRQKIVKVFKEIKIRYRELYGTQMTVTPLQREKNIGDFTNIAYGKIAHTKTTDIIDIVNRMEQLEAQEDQDGDNKEPEDENSNEKDSV